MGSRGREHQRHRALGRHQRRRRRRHRQQRRHRRRHCGGHRRWPKGKVKGFCSYFGTGVGKGEDCIIGLTLGTEKRSSVGLGLGRVVGTPIGFGVVGSSNGRGLRWWASRRRVGRGRRRKGGSLAQGSESPWAGSTTRAWDPDWVRAWVWTLGAAWAAASVRSWALAWAGRGHTCEQRCRG